MSSASVIDATLVIVAVYCLAVLGALAANSGSAESPPGQGQPSGFIVMR